MKDKILRAVIDKNGKKAYVDFCNHKGFDVIINALKRINYQDKDYYLVSVSDVDLHFTNYSDEFKKIKDLVQPNTRLLELLGACRTLCKEDKDLLSYIEGKFNSDEISDVSHISFFEQKYYFNETLKEHPIVILDPNTITYEQIIIFNKKALFTPCRIDKHKLPKGVYVYEAMADDEQNGEIVTLGKKISVNFWGTILTTSRIALNNGYRHVDEDKDVDFLTKTNLTLKDYLKKSLPNKKRELCR